VPTVLLRQGKAQIVAVNLPPLWREKGCSQTLRAIRHHWPRLYRDVKSLDLNRWRPRSLGGLPVRRSLLRLQSHLLPRLEVVVHKGPIFWRLTHSPSESWWKSSPNIRGLMSAASSNRLKLSEDHLVVDEVRGAFLSCVLVIFPSSYALNPSLRDFLRVLLRSWRGWCWPLPSQT